jgi:hypothetical protein
MPLKAQLEIFSHFAANVAALDHLSEPLTAPSTAAAIEGAAKQQHKELIEEARWGHTYLVDFFLVHLHCLLAWALHLLGVVVPRRLLVLSAPARAANDNDEEGDNQEDEDEE